LIENAIQEAYLRALERWPDDGTPDQAEGWLARVAHNALVDVLRRPAADALEDSEAEPPAPPPQDEDDELRLLFVCCDPVLPRAAQIALVLSVAFGLTARQISGAFLSDERTVSQRIVRSKQKLRDQGVTFDLPDRAFLSARLGTVLEVLYVLFGEGYHPSLQADELGEALCADALRLVRRLTESALTASPAAFALRALFCFHASRLPARVADDGSLLLLPEQDRNRWNAVLAEEGFTCLGKAGAGDALTRFHLEAAIAACHALAPSYADTEWVRVVELYDMLRTSHPSVVVDVNRAVAVGMKSGARAGLDELDGIPERDVLARYPYALAAYADLHASLGNLDEAAEYLHRALGHQSFPAQRALLRRKLAALDIVGNHPETALRR